MGRHRAAGCCKAAVLPNYLRTEWAAAAHAVQTRGAVGVDVRPPDGPPWPPWLPPPQELRTKWKFSATLDLPWKPVLAAAGGTTHVFDQASAGAAASRRGGQEVERLCRDAGLPCPSHGEPLPPRGGAPPTQGPWPRQVVKHVAQWRASCTTPKPRPLLAPPCPCLHALQARAYAAAIPRPHLHCSLPARQDTGLVARHMEGRLPRLVRASAVPTCHPPPPPPALAFPAGHRPGGEAHRKLGRGARKGGARAAQAQRQSARHVLGGADVGGARRRRGGHVVCGQVGGWAAWVRVRLGTAQVQAPVCLLFGMPS